MYSPLPVIGCVLGLASVTTWDEIEKKIGLADVSFCFLHIACAACICTLHLQLAFASKHLHIAFADCICTLHLYIAFAACIFNSSAFDFSPPTALSQPSKQNSLLAINLEPIELIFSTPPTSPNLFFDLLKDLPPQTANLPPPQPSFDTIERLANQTPPILVMEPPLPPLPPHLLPLGSNNAFPVLTQEMFCEHCQRTQVLVNDLCEEMTLIFNHILERLNVLAHQNLP
ncbi:hypothetical protein Tco_0674302 [Tanacetum coccineum]